MRRTPLSPGAIVAEVALSVVLLAGAGLLFRSFMRLQAVNTGFVAQQILTARISPSGINFNSEGDYVSFYRRALERISTIPGVQDVGAINLSGSSAANNGIQSRGTSSYNPR
jgi:putative ABC transport system permease protein